MISVSFPKHKVLKLVQIILIAMQVTKQKEFAERNLQERVLRSRVVFQCVKQLLSFCLVNTTVVDVTHRARNNVFRSANDQLTTDGAPSLLSRSKLLLTSCRGSFVKLDGSQFLFGSRVLFFPVPNNLAHIDSDSFPHPTLEQASTHSGH